MKLIAQLLKHAITLVLVLCTYIVQSQESPTIKYLEKDTIDEVKIDFDNDGDLDFIIAGVNTERRQGRVYIVENKGPKLGKPEYIYSYPTVSVKQHLDIQQKGDVTTIIIMGTSPSGKLVKYIGTLNKGEFAGLILPPATTSSQK